MFYNYAIHFRKEKLIVNNNRVLIWALPITYLFSHKIMYAVSRLKNCFTFTSLGSLFMYFHILGMGKFGGFFR